MKETSHQLPPLLKRGCGPVLAMPVAVCLLLSPCHLVTLSPCHGAEADQLIDSPMYRDPDLPAPPVVTVFPKRAKELWLKALQRPEAEMRFRAADAIALAHRRGMKGMETTVAPLVAVLDRPDQHPTVRLAAARALVTLEAREAAPSLFKQAQAGDVPLREAVEPALARWDYRPARAMWLERLRDPATPHRALVLAVRGLGAVRETEAADRLREMVLSGRTPGPVRLEAARALGAVRGEGLEADAERLAADGLVARLAAAALLQRHQGEAAVRLLRQLARDPEPAVAALAAGRLLEIDPKLVLPVLEHLLASRDAKVRSLGVEALRRLPAEKHVRPLADRLDDAHPEVRVNARRALHEFAAKKELRATVIAEAVRTLAGRQWRALEQAAILLTQLDHKPAAGRLLALLTFDRPEVFVTAAWGLRKLAVPVTLPAVLAYVDGESKRRLTGQDLPNRRGVSGAMIDHQLSQLNQFLGRQKYGPADAVLRRFIPHIGDRLGAESRTAAVWALGLLHEGKGDSGLAGPLQERLKD
ncbi:MAG TPA: HEAT repeat domain-containing protein, partial [Gemmataceae bacterium]|nr:HEAT repeat domain-containing protein [Gemmataceae bacterium]